MAIAAPITHDPQYPEYIYVNRKNYHSINVQLVINMFTINFPKYKCFLFQICDENLKILNVNARFPGSSHDAHIWRQSRVSQIMEEIYRRNPMNPFFLLGDSGMIFLSNFIFCYLNFTIFRN